MDELLLPDELNTIGLNLILTLTVNDKINWDIRKEELSYRCYLNDISFVIHFCVDRNTRSKRNPIKISHVSLVSTQEVACIRFDYDPSKKELYQLEKDMNKLIYKLRHETFKLNHLKDIHNDDKLYDRYCKELNASYKSATETHHFVAVAQPKVPVYS